MDIAISSVSPYPIRGNPLEGAAPSAQGFGALLRGGDSSPPSGAETLRAGPSDEPVKGGQETGGDVFGTSQGTAVQPLLPSVPHASGQMQPPIPEIQGTSDTGLSDGSEEPHPAMQPLGGGGIKHHKALVVAAGIGGGFEGIHPLTTGADDIGPGTIQGSLGPGDRGVQRTDADVVAFRMTPPEEGSSTDLLVKGGLEQPSGGGSGHGDSDVGSVHRDTHIRPSEPPDSDADLLQPPGNRQTLDSATHQVGSGEVQRFKAKVVAAAVLDKPNPESGGELLERASGGPDRVEPTVGSGATQHRSRVLGRPVDDTAFERARQEGVEPAVRGENTRVPEDRPDTGVQRHKATVVAAGVEPPEDGHALDGPSSPTEPRQTASSQRAAPMEANGGTVKPTAYGVRVLPNQVTLPEVTDVGQSAWRDVTVNRAPAGVEQAHTSVRPAAVATGVAAYGGSEVRVPAQPFPRLDFRF